MTNINFPKTAKILIPESNKSKTYIRITIVDTYIIL